jgi:aspartate aminotransferase
MGGQAPTTRFELADMILDECGVAAALGQAFGPSDYLRFSHAIGDSDLAEGISRMLKFFS